jgi:hypothetical protein
MQAESNGPKTEPSSAPPGSPLAELGDQRTDRRGRELEVIKLELDKDGAPLTIEPRAWFVCFVPGLKKQWWHRFVNERHKHVFAMRPAGPGLWTLFERWWHRLLTATITSEQARKFLIWGARGDVLHVREAVPGRGSQVRGWMTCATLASFLLGRKYWVWTPHGLYKLLLRELGVCRVDVSALLRLDEAKLAEASLVLAACEKGCAPGAPKNQRGAPKPFCMDCGRYLVPGWNRPEMRTGNGVLRRR